MLSIRFTAKQTLIPRCRLHVSPSAASVSFVLMLSHTRFDTTRSDCSMLCLCLSFLNATKISLQLDIFIRLSAAQLHATTIPIFTPHWRSPKFESTKVQGSFQFPFFNPRQYGLVLIPRTLCLCTRICTWIDSLAVLL